MARNNNKYRRVKIRTKHITPHPGASPGMIVLQEGALPPKIVIHAYNQEHYTATPANHISDIVKPLSDPKLFYWIEIKGLGDLELYEQLASGYGINKLVLEDVSNTYQRPKFEEYDDYLFAVSRMLYFNEDKQLENEQVSFILKNNVIISIEEDYHDCIEPVRNRLKVGKGNIRGGGPAYMMYAIMDVIVDNYFSVLSKFGDELEDIEDRLYERPDRSIMYETQAIKRSLIVIRRAAWPERDKLNDILRSASPLITDQTKMYVRDAYDHCIQIMDLIESHKEVTASLIDMYLSFISNRMNEIMKVLTIMSSIFIPLTFIAGIYGMNFARQDPVTGKILTDNMPELYAEHGYLYTIIIMLAIAALQVWYFARKGWFK